MRTLLFVLLTIQAMAQPGRRVYTKELKHDSVFCDCNLAREIILQDDIRIWKTLTPAGGGLVNEIPEKKLYSFEKEHNTAWYKLIITAPGKLMFDIMPTNPCDDYDFMLFKATSGNFCDSLLSKDIKPVRACISRNKDEIRGRTGLNNQSGEEYVRTGIAPSYCKYVEVNAGDTFYLVLDNVYENGSGHSIEFSITSDIKISGVVTDGSKKSFKTDVAVTNNSGDTIAITKTSKDGTYDFTLPVSQHKTYSINFYNDSNFVFSRNFTIHDTVVLKSLNTILPKLKKGRKYSVGTINFIGNEIRYLPSAIPALNNLTRLMKKNKSLRIKIIGHCNQCSTDGVEHAITFSTGRAQTVKSFLLSHYIDDSRMEIGGRGDYEMRYHDPQNSWQAEQNRRVEILVLDY